MNLFKKLILATLGFLALAGTVYASSYPSQNQSYQITAAGASVGDTTLVINAFNNIATSTAGAYPVTMAQFGSIGYGVLEPGNGSQEESITFSGVTQNSNNTATLTGIQDCGFIYPFATTTGLTKNHAGASTFALSNTSCFYNGLFANVNNPETITGQWTFSSTTFLTATSTASTSLVNYGEIGSIVGTATSSLLTANNTWTGVNTYNGSSVFASTTTFNTSIPTTSLTPTLSNQLATKAYVDGVAIAGGVIANNTTTGIGRVASSTQIAQGSSGGTTTAYWIPSTLASSTASTTSVALVTKASDGKIDPSFLNGSAENYTFAGNTTFTGTTTLATTTLIFASYAAFPTFYATSTTYNISSAGTTTLPHGMSTIPRLIQIQGYYNVPTSNALSQTQTVYTGGSQSSMYTYCVPNSSGCSAGGNGNTFTFQDPFDNGSLTGIVTTDSTNIYIAWTKSGSTSGTARLLVQAYQ